MVDERRCEVCAASIESEPDGVERPKSRWVPDVKFLSGRGSGDRVMKRTLITLALGATVAIGAVASPTTAHARWHRRFPVAPNVGGLAAGAILGAALGAPRTVMYELIMGRHASFGASASGTAGAGTFAA
jgi:hypothetical protein